VQPERADHDVHRLTLRRQLLLVGMDVVHSHLPARGCAHDLRVERVIPLVVAAAATARRKLGGDVVPHEPQHVAGHVRHHDDAHVTAVS
jgi:hypothetical protein